VPGPVSWAKDALRNTGALFGHHLNVGGSYACSPGICPAKRYVLENWG
jgi:hypothetical protein